MKILFFFFWFYPIAFSATSVVIDINKPSFRKIVAAVPDFKVQSQDHQLKAQSVEASLYMRGLMEFSGLFHLIPFNVYDGMETKALLPVPLPQGIPGFENVDLPSWKTLGVESLSFVTIEPGATGTKGTTTHEPHQITFQTADLMQHSRILSRSYHFKTTEDLKKHIRHYLDELLKAYTGKPGIFSTRILFVGRKTKKDFKQVYTCDIDGKNVEQHTFEKALHVAPAWAPDGKGFLYTSYEKGNPDLYHMDLTTKKKTVVSSTKGVNISPSYSSDGSVFVYSASINSITKIFYSHPLSKNRFLLIDSKGIEVDADISPDNQWISFVSDRFGNPHIFRAKLNWNYLTKTPSIDAPTRLTFAGWYNATPAWSKDSQKIAFASFDKEINRFDLFMMNADGSQLERLTLKVGDNENPTWSPNGELIMFHSSRLGTNHTVVDAKGPFQLFLMNRDGSGQRPVLTGMYDAQTPKWGPSL